MMAGILYSLSDLNFKLFPNLKPYYFSSYIFYLFLFCSKSCQPFLSAYCAAASTVKNNVIACFPLCSISLSVTYKQNSIFIFLITSFLHVLPTVWTVSQQMAKRSATVTGKRSTIWSLWIYFFLLAFVVFAFLSGSEYLFLYYPIGLFLCCFLGCWV